MKLVSDKSKVYPELFDPDLSSAYYFSPGEGALNQFRTLKNSGDAEVLAVWKEIARLERKGCILAAASGASIINTTAPETARASRTAGG